MNRSREGSSSKSRMLRGSEVAQPQPGLKHIGEWSRLPWSPGFSSTRFDYRESPMISAKRLVKHTIIADQQNTYCSQALQQAGLHQQSNRHGVRVDGSDSAESEGSEDTRQRQGYAGSCSGSRVLARVPQPQSCSSEVSLSKYRPSAPRFRIEQEGNSLVVMPVGFPKRWPPQFETELGQLEAEDVIGRGAPRFVGKLREAANGYHFFAFAGKEWDEETDTAAFQSDSFGDMSSAPEGKQTDALERPAMAHAFGTYPGTVTLAYYVTCFGSEARGAEIATRGKVRKLTMLYVLDRLRSLQVNGIEEDDLDLHNHLYEFLLHSSHTQHHSVDLQIADLVAALCRPSWVDFSRAENHIAARFLADPSLSNGFFHQLLLSVELYLRIKTRHMSAAGLPEPVRWNLMLAQRWLENVEIEPPQKLGSREKSSIGFRFPNKKNQIDALKNFAWTLKWPNMHEVEYTLSEEEDPNELLEDRSPNCMSWFTGLLLPGKSMPWILMSALIDCDVDTPEEFHNLEPSSPNVGFQYRGHTYWSWECIVGKVLGATSGVSQIAGWVGPCSASADLGRSEVAKINQSPHKGNRISSTDVQSMDDNSKPIGPYGETYPVSDYVATAVDAPVDSIRIERLNFSPAANNPTGIHQQPKRPVVAFDASITFAVTIEQRARSWKVSLRHDTPFVAAYPCQNGPHVLYCEYRYRSVGVDDLVEIQDWADTDEVLVVNALGVTDNEVFARAWCSFWGLPSITADLNRTCIACAVREAYAALINVVILMDRRSADIDVEEVDRLMENL